MASAGVFDLELNDASNDQDGSSDVSDEEEITIDEDQVRVCCVHPVFSPTFGFRYPQRLLGVKVPLPGSKGHLVLWVICLKFPSIILSLTLTLTPVLTLTIDPED